MIRLRICHVPLMGRGLIAWSCNLIMAYSHVAHDCRVGNNCVLANGSTLAGHVTIEDRAVIGGLVAIHQFVRVGQLSIIGGCSKVVQDIPPYSTCDGHPAAVFGLLEIAFGNGMAGASRRTGRRRGAARGHGSAHGGCGVARRAAVGD